MKRTKLSILLGAILLALGISPPALEAGCGECVYRPETYDLCLLGCSVNDPNCEQVHCTVIWGRCSAGTCGYALAEPILSSGQLGQLLSPDETAADELAVARLVDEDGSLVSRVACNAVVVDREFPAPLALAVQARTHTLSI